MKQRLGEKKGRKIEKLTGKKLNSAYTRGGWEHYWAQCFFEGERYTLNNPPPMVNYITGEIDYNGNKTIPLFRSIMNIKRKIEMENAEILP